MPSPADPIPSCPRCHGIHVVRNGHNRSGSANHLCRGCGRQFVADPKKGPVPAATQALGRRLLLERIGRRAIARSVGVSRSWLQAFAHALDRGETPHARPAEYRAGAVVCTDSWAAYQAAVPDGRHVAGGKGPGSPTGPSGSGVPSASGAAGWSGKRYRSRSASGTMSGHSGTSSDTTTHYCIRATTETNSRTGSNRASTNATIIVQLEPS